MSGGKAWRITLCDISDEGEKEREIEREGDINRGIEFQGTMADVISRFKLYLTETD